jgi:cytochrome P450
MLIMSAANTRALSFNTSVFGADAHRFNPERFLNASPTQLATMERTNFHFSQGKRNCIGMNIAWMEMLKLIPAMVKEFDVSALAGCTDCETDSMIQIELANPYAVREEDTWVMNYTRDLHVKLSPLDGKTG